MFWGKQRPKLTGRHKQTLRALKVDENGPGTILRDFEMLLSFVRGQDLPVSKTYHLLPLKVLPKVNAQLAYPIELGLKRPQLKSYPHIQGLYLLLRASGLGCIHGTRSKPRLVIDQEVYDSWSSLNPTERYFTLLETWLLRGRPQIVGERDFLFRMINENFEACATLLQAAQGEGLPIAGNDHADRYVLYSPGLYGIALLELFGFLAVQHGQPQEGKGWQIDRVSATPLGEAVFALLYEQLFRDWDKIHQLDEALPATFDVLQPVFQPYAPTWKDSHSLPVWTFDGGVHVFKVTLWSDLWRRIAVSGWSALDTLAEAILDAFEFDHDHLYRFSYRNRFGVEAHINHSYLEEKPWTSEVSVGSIPLQLGQSMIYLYDFGDCWEFDVTLEGIDPASAEQSAPVVLDGQGDAPEQYPDWGEE